MAAAVLILGALAVVSVGLGWECDRCGAHTGMLWPRPCDRCSSNSNP